MSLHARSPVRRSLPRLLLGFGAIGVVVAFLWFAGAGEWFGLAPSSRDAADSRHADHLGDAGVEAAGGAGAAKEIQSDDASQRMVLFGHPKLARVGVGSTRGRVMDFDAGKPVAEALLVLEGTANEGVSIAARARADMNGRFEFSKVRSGDAYRLQVQAEGYPDRLVDAVVVTAHAEADLGDIWLGGKGLLEGRVVDADGRGIGQAIVRLHRGASPVDNLIDEGEWFANFDREVHPLAMVHGNAEGHFRIPDVEPGRITLVVRAAGYAQAINHAVMTPTGVAGDGLLVELAARAPLRGMVVDDSGRGVGRARVAWFHAPEFARSTAVGGVFAETGPDGRFEVPAPPTPEGAGMIVAADGCVSDFQAIQPGESALRIVLAGGAELLVRLTIDGGRASPAGAAVSIFFEEEHRSSGGALVRGVTDSRGEVRLPARPGSLWCAFVRHPEAGAGAWTPYVTGESSDYSPLRGPGAFTLVAGENTLELALGRGQVVVGHVRDPDGKPLAGVRLVARGMGCGESVMSATDGSYSLRTMELTSHVVASLTGYVQHLGPMKLVGLSDEGETRDAAGRTVVDVVMSPAGVLEGRIVDEAGRPIVGAAVELAGYGSKARYVQRCGTTTHEGGRYLLDGVEPGSAVKVTASSIGYVSATSTGVEVKAGAAIEVPEIVLRRGATLQVEVQSAEGAPVGGARVQLQIDPSDGVERPIDEMPMSGEQSFVDRTTGAAGIVQFVALPAGKITLSATATGTGGARYVYELEAAQQDAVHELLLPLRPATSLEGRVVGERGEALVGVEVAVGPKGSHEVEFFMPVPERHPPGPIQDWIPIRIASTDSAGRFFLADLPPGPLPLKFTHKGHIPLKVQLSDRGDRGDFRLVTRAEREQAAEHRKRVEAENHKKHGAFDQRVRVLSEEHMRFEEGR